MTETLIPQFFQHVLLAGLAAVVFVVLLQRLSDIAHPYRLMLAAEGEAYLAGCKDQVDAQTIRFMLDHAFSWWVAVAFAFMLPWYLGIAAIRHLRGGRVNGRLSPEKRRLVILFAISAFAANPVFGTVVVVELFVFGLIASMISSPAAAMAGVYRALQFEARSLRGGARA